MKKRELELIWDGKNERATFSPVTLVEDLNKSYNADAECIDNKLIRGENLGVLDALREEYERKVKCVVIDPPYNTGNLFTHYADKRKNSEWLGWMRDRIERIHPLMADDGSMWITVDDNEAHYLKVMCDEIFGRNNFVANVVWQRKTHTQNEALRLSPNHDHILVYAKKKKIWRSNHLPRTEKLDEPYRNPDNDPRGPWKRESLTVKAGGPSTTYQIEGPNGELHFPPRGRHWGCNRQEYERLLAEKLIDFGPNGNLKPRCKVFLKDVRRYAVCKTIWTAEEVGSTTQAIKESLYLNKSSLFVTPKPEKLIHRILTLSTQPGDLVLDCFAGSGTTGAVAHKMARQWIMVELGEQCDTHIIPRMKKIIDGADTGGATSLTKWEGGGGFRYFNVAPL